MPIKEMFDFSVHGWNRTAKILCGLSFMFILIGAGSGIYRLNYLQKAVATQAIITNLIERKNDDGDTLYAPVYLFKDQTGKEVKVISSTASWPPIGEIGDPIEVLYLPSDPHNSIPNKFSSKWGFSVVPATLGLFYTIVFALIAYFAGRSIRKKSKTAQQARPNDTPHC